jgi:uncharacterized integral membrane protein
MVLRLLGFIIILVVFLLFIGFNLENRCDIQFWFTKEAIFSGVPVYITAFVSFIAGMLCALPIMVLVHLNKKKQAKRMDSQAATPKKQGKRPSPDTDGTRADY